MLKSIIIIIFVKASYLLSFCSVLSHIHVSKSVDPFKCFPHHQKEKRKNKKKRGGGEIKNVKG